jgi:hypothetical protein
MKQIVIYKIYILAAFFSLYACAGMSLENYQTTSTDEEEIIGVILRHENAWNEQDISGFMATYHNNALIEFGCTGPLVSKFEFADKIEQMMGRYPTVKLTNPELNLSDNNAIVKVTSTGLGDESHFFRLEMLKENEQWFITKETCI